MPGRFSKLLVLAAAPVIFGWAVMLAVLMGLGAMGAVLGTAHSYGSDRAEPGNVPLEYIDWIRQAGQDCTAVPASVLAAIAATTSRWDPAHQDQGRTGLMWLPSDVVQAHPYDAEPNGMVDPLAVPDAVMMTAVWLCDLAGPDAKADPLLVDELIAAYETGALTLPAPPPGPVATAIMEPGPPRPVPRTRAVHRRAGAKEDPRRACVAPPRVRDRLRAIHCGGHEPGVCAQRRRQGA